MPAPPASVLSAILVTNSGDPSSPLRVATFSQSGQGPLLPSLTNDVVVMPQDAELDANGTWTGFLSTLGLPGATAPARWVGATAAGAPAAGTFSAGDFAVSADGNVYVCTAAGSPGTWIRSGSTPTVPVPIANGGTGGTTAAGALNALGVALVPSGNTATDTATLQNLINAGAKTITLAASTWTVNTLTPKSGVRITGAGYTATTLQAASGQSLFSMDPGTQLDNVEIDHMTLQAAAGQPVFSGMYITRSSVHDCYLNAASGSASSSIWLSNSGTGYMAECRFYHNREQVYGTSRTVAAWDLTSNNNTTQFQVNDNHWHDNVCFDNDKDTAAYWYKVSYSASGFATATSNANTFEDIVFEFPTGGMIWLDSCSYTSISRCTCEDFAASTVGNPLIQVTKNANGGGPVGNKIRSYSRRGGTYAGIVDIQLVSNCNNTVIDSPFQAGGGTALTINYGSSSNVTAVGVPSTAAVSNYAGTGAVKAAPASFHPANPTATASGTLVMMGLGSTCTYTPTSSGKVQVTVTGNTLTNTAAAQITLGGRYGTGAAPANGAAVTGTTFGAATDQSIRAATFTAGVPFTLNDVLSLTAGTTYWIDVALDTATAADTAQITSVGVTAVELS